MKPLWWLLRVAVYVVPIVILALGVPFIIRTASHLLDPGVPVAGNFITPAGDLLVRAERYQWDLASGRLTLQGARVTEPDGNTLLSLDRASVSGVRPNELSAPVLSAEVDGAFARLTRERDGQLALNRYFPPSDEEPATVPFTATIRNFTLEIDDRKAARPWNRRVRSPMVWLAGLGDDLLVRTQATLDRTGSLLAAGQVGKENGAFTIAAGRLSLDDVVAHLRQVEPDVANGLREVAARGLTAGGRAQVAWNPRREVRYRWQGSARAEALRVQRVALSEPFFQGLLTPEGVWGQARVVRNRSRLAFSGSTQLQAPFRIAGRADATLDDFRDLPEISLPQLTVRNLPVQGWVEGPAESVRFAVRSPGIQARFEGRDVAVQNVAAWGTAQAVAFRAERGRGAGVDARNIAGGWEARSQRLSAWSEAEVPRLEAVAAPVKGRAEGRVWVTGTMAKPEIGARLALQVQAEAEPLRRPANVAGTVAVRLDGDEISLERFDGRALDSAVVGFGSARSPEGLVLWADDLELGDLDPRATGNARLRAVIRGDLKQPRYQLRAQAFELRWEDFELPAATLTVEGDRDVARITDFRAVDGTVFAQGSAQVRLVSGAIDGRFRATGVRLGSYLPGQSFGAIDIPQLTVQGTLQQPRVAGNVTAENIVLEGVLVDRLAGRVELENGVVAFGTQTLDALDGKAQLTGRYRLADGTGFARGSVTQLDLARLSTELGDAVKLTGRGDARLSLDLRDGRPNRGRVVVETGDIQVNGAETGRLIASANLVDGRLTGDASLGFLDRYVQVSELLYNVESQKGRARVDAFNVQLPTLVAMGLKYVPADNFELRQELRGLVGDVTGSLDARIDGQTVDGEIPVLTVQNLGARGRDLGELSIAVAKAGEIYTVRDVRLNGPLANANLRGTVAANGEVAFDGEVKSISLTEAGQFAGLADLPSGTVDVSFVAGGTRDRPTLQASVLADGLFRRPNTPDDTGLRVILDELTLDAGTEVGGTAQATGRYFYRGFQGLVELSAPYELVRGLPEEGEIRGRATLNERTLNELAPYIDAIDTERSEGVVGGEVRIAGRVNDLRLSGQVTARAPRLTLRGLDDELRELDMTLALTPEALSLDAATLAARGGRLAAEARVDLSRVTRLADLVQGPLRDRLGELPVAGRITSEGLTVRQSLPAGGFVRAQTDGAITIAGNLAEPQLQGEIAFAGVDSVISGFDAPSGEAAPPPINPRFDIALRTEGPAHLRSATLDVFTSGSGQIAGRLTEPEVTAELILDRGSLRLPGGQVRLDPNGRMSFRYDQEPVADAQLNVDLTGRTAVTAAAEGQLVQRYDVELVLRGNLLREGELQFDATSDPPGLSSARVLALLGQTELIAGLATGSDNLQSSRDRIQNAILGFALPSVLDPVTASVARTFGLDYITLEYISADESYITVGKALSREWSAQARRGLVPPPPGLPWPYDLRLTYRPRRLLGRTSRLSFSLGRDEQREFKVTFEYGVRF